MRIFWHWMYALGCHCYPPAIQNVPRAIGDMADRGFDHLGLEGFGEDNLGQVIKHAGVSEERLADGMEENRWQWQELPKKRRTCIIN